MSITGTGIVLIILGLYGFFFNSKFLYNVVIFFIPFTATAVINVGSSDAGSAISPFMFLGLLWLISLFIKKDIKFITKACFRKSEYYTLLLLLCFCLVTFISLIMPIIIDGKENGNVSGVLSSSNPIIFSTRNITQFAYLLFGILMSIGIYFHNKIESNYRSTIKVYSFSILFVIFWGCFELICFYKNINYPSFIFNNSISNAAQPFDSFLQTEEVTKRIISVTVEPSNLVQNVLFILPFFIIAMIKQIPIFNKYYDIFFIFIIILFVIRSTSAIGIVCLGLIMVWSFIFYINNLPNNKKFQITILSFFVGPLLMLLTYGMFSSLINSILFDKTGTYSALERSSAIIDAWSTFLNHPILGAGWGSVTSFDLFIKILSNTGILGLIFFVSFLIKILINQIKKTTDKYNKSIYKQAILISFCTLMISSILSGFGFVFGFFWLATGLMLITNFHSINKT